MVRAMGGRGRGWSPDDRISGAATATGADTGADKVFTKFLAEVTHCLMRVSLGNVCPPVSIKISTTICAELQGLLQQNDL